MEIKIYDKLPREAERIRREVFMSEQGFKNESDDIDERACHLVAFDGEIPAGTCRVYRGEDGEYYLGRLAVVKAYRGGNVGSGLVEAAKKIRKKSWRGEPCSALPKAGAGILRTLRIFSLRRGGRGRGLPPFMDARQPLTACGFSTLCI